MNDTTAFIPFSQPHIDEATIERVNQVLRSGWLTSGPQVKAFENALSAYLGNRLVRCFNSGTCTLEIALRIMGIGKGDEVITTPISWVATANVILAVGAVPVFVDIDPHTRNIDINKIEKAITPRTKAILPVYLAGLPLHMDQLYALAKAYQLRVIEDAAQALGSCWQGQPIGSFGDMTSFSFQANKNITTAEGGCLVVNDPEEAFLAEKYRLQGVTRGEWDTIDVDVLGGKYNMTDIAAAIGLGQLSELQTFTTHRRMLAAHYFDLFGPNFETQSGAMLPIQDHQQTNWHLFQIILPETFTRRAFMQKMAEMRIGIGFHYAPIHLFTLYRKLGFKEGMFPVAEHIGQQIVSLPMFNTLSKQEVERVVSAVKKILC